MKPAKWPKIPLNGQSDESLEMQIEVVMIKQKRQDWNICMLLDWGDECVVAAGSGMGRLVHTPSGRRLAGSSHIADEFSARTHTHTFRFHVGVDKAPFSWFTVARIQSYYLSWLYIRSWADVYHI